MSKSIPAQNPSVSHEISRELKSGLTENSRAPKNGLSEISLGNNAVTVIDGQPMANSYEVALTFQKEHRHVLRRIQSLDCSPEFRARNFAESEQTVKNGNVSKQVPYYRMTFDGFVFLVGGFTGKKAAAFKEAYINRFNLMRDELARRAEPASVTMQDTRLLVSINRFGQTQAMPVPSDAYVISPDQLAGLMADPDGFTHEQTKAVLIAGINRLVEQYGSHGLGKLLRQVNPDYLLVRESELVTALYSSPAITGILRHGYPEVQA